MHSLKYQNLILIKFRKDDFLNLGDAFTVFSDIYRKQKPAIRFIPEGRFLSLLEIKVIYLYLQWLPADYHYFSPPPWWPF